MLANPLRPTRLTEVRHHPERKTCHHFDYHGLTCNEYDQLRARAAGHCEICGIAEKDTRRGSLVIDHFQNGQASFIRGMICDSCNSGVMSCIDGIKAWGANRKWEAAARAYEANSWEKPSPAALEAMAAREEKPSPRPARLSDPSASAAIDTEPARRDLAALAARLRAFLGDDEVVKLAALLERAQ